MGWSVQSFTLITVGAFTLLLDLTMSCDSWDSNADYDIVPRPIPGDHLNPIACYLGEHMEKFLTHPYASPLFGDFNGLPPMLIQAGECEVLRDENTLLAHKAKLAGVEVRHELYEDAVHVFQALPFLETAQLAFGSCRDFVLHFLPQYQRKTPQGLAGETERGLEEEIGTGAQRVVAGDGTETASRREDISGSSAEQSRERPPLTADAGREESPSRSDEDEPSWSTRWPTPSESEESEDEGDHLRMKRKNTATALQVKPHAPESDRPTVKAHSERHKPHPRPSLRRLRSTFSFIADASYRSASEHVLSAPAHRERGEPALENQHAAAASNIRPRTATLSMASVPSPTARKTLGHDASHPDIHSLIQQYASTGPAHETMTIRPEDSPRRRRSRTLSGR